MPLIKHRQTAGAHPASPAPSSCSWGCSPEVDVVGEPSNQTDVVVGIEDATSQAPATRWIRIASYAFFGIAVAQVAHT